MVVRGTVAPQARVRFPEVAFSHKKMKISTHTILAVIAYFIIQPYFGTQNALLFAISSVIIDIDHWFWAIYKNKKWLWLHEAYFWNLKEIKQMSIKEAKGKKVKPVLHVFHTIEFILLMLATSFFLPVLWPVFWGIVFHNTCDTGRMLVKGIHSRRRWSLFQKG